MRLCIVASTAVHFWYRIRLSEGSLSCCCLTQQELETQQQQQQQEEEDRESGGLFQPVSVVLEPGDLLYIPPMMVHHVEALSKPTIGFNVFSGSLVSELRSVHKRPSLGQ